jgi:hypothetical protein
MFGRGAFILCVGDFVQDACCCGRPSSFIAAPPSALKMNTQYCLGPCCTWCQWSQRGGPVVEKGQPPTSHPNVSSPRIPSVLGASCGCPRALLPLAVALADMPLDLVQHVLFLFPSTRVLVLTGGPMQALAVVTSRVRAASNSRIPSLKNNIFFPQVWWHVLGPTYARVGLGMGSAPGGWCLLT